MTAPDPHLGERFDNALIRASGLFRNTARKGGTIPYISHLLGVCSLVLEAGGDEDQAIAALLHDAIEDCPQEMPYEQIASEFGARVADVVRGCSDSEVEDKEPWRKRKETYLKHLPQSSPDVLLVSLADKLYNARTILADYRSHGNKLWKRFNADKSGVLWYYSELSQIFSKLRPGSMAQELARTVADLKAEVGE